MTMNLSVGLILATIAISQVYPAQFPSFFAIPELQHSRTVKDGVLSSTEMPKVRIKFPKPFKYVGTQSFILYEVAQAEQHFFVDSDKDGHIKRLYWIQFEGYLPSNNHSYDYQSNQRVNLGGFEFIADAFAWNIKENLGRSDSDGNRARTLLEGKGYKISDEVLIQRLVYMVDDAKRNELMIIYLEDLSMMGFTAADLSAGGKAAEQWPQISKALLDRASKGMEILR